MNRLVLGSLALAMAVAAGGASAQAYYDDRGYDDRAYDDRGYGEGAYDDGGYDNGYAYGGNDAYPVQRQDYYGSSNYQGQAETTDMARVLSVDPIVQPGQPVSRRECWSEPTQTYAGNGGYQQAYDPRYGQRQDPRYAQRTSGGGAVLGAIVGGVLGNTVGDGDGRKAATVVGAVLGGAIGNDIERRNGQRYSGAYGGQAAGYYPAQEVQRCRVVNEQTRDERVVGYRVAYEYGGRTYQTMTDYHPGSEIRVRVAVTPEG